ncbi:vWA domain-containing protein [Pedobacter frigiditerrae]|uniref:vWA domain-containing protein n=1 Tax=Pedobacter frigiditerrae TaxID=2530452 RepID=UPI00292CF861|nr:von Willebrand factor type A domain-containing protein [Pedobacter frigiditerrae]
MKKILTIILAFFLFVGFKAANQRIISGLVTDKADGLQMTGADVKSLPSNKATVVDVTGKFSLKIPITDTAIVISYLGYQAQTIKLTKNNSYKIEMVTDRKTLDQVVVTAAGVQVKRRELSSHSTSIVAKEITQAKSFYAPSALTGKVAGLSAKSNSSIKIRGNSSTQIINNTESYSAISEIGFRKANKAPLSTFSIDVDAAAYSNVRRFINNGGLPPKDAVRIEEMVNYFDYDYAQPTAKDPVNIVTEIAPAPWNPKHRLLHIGLQAKTVSTEKLPASNLVFLIDVSGSMSDANKLPLLVSSLKLLTDQLREKDKVAIVVYAGSSGLALPSTAGDNKIAIKEALNRLNAGGSTAGGAGLTLAYKIATENFIKGGNNRIILATDGDFNVGQSSDLDMQKLIEEKRKTGVFLTVLGYGMGNYKDSKMETLADKGNGNYAYIDNITEAKKVLVNEFGGTLFTVAKDVKFQLEFNPTKVQAYRLIGYENRMLNSEDFNDDKKDAGEIGSGHTVTALYEIIPVGIQSEFIGSVDPLKYQKTKKNAVENASDEMLTIKLRYKEPDESTSKLIQETVIDNTTKDKSSVSSNFNFSAAVAEFGMLLRQSDYKQQSNFEQVIQLAEGSLGKDKDGYRSEFLRLAKSTQLMAKDLLTIANSNGIEENKR